jgi:uncharacterized protein (DUF1810 family)
MVCVRGRSRGRRSAGRVRQQQPPAVVPVKPLFSSLNGVSLESLYMEDPYHLQRFVDAQRDVFIAVTEELRRGQKSGHWIWFIFPQILGLGQTSTSRHFAISGPAEARAYLTHSLLGSRIRMCTEMVNAIEGRTAEQIFGYPDFLKFRSSMTLFDYVEQGRNPFADALRKFYGGEPDARTLNILNRLEARGRRDRPDD